MTDLVKIREVSLNYGVSTRTLRYYEDLGLIKSGRIADYSYRCYDQENLRKLEQILILRKLNISIKDIKRIFASNSAKTILEVLSNKVIDIDKESALLYELRTLILKFIKQIEKYDFNKEADIKLLYERANEIEKQITSVSIDSEVPLEKMIEITEKLEKEIEIRLVQLPAMQMILSPCGNPEEPTGELQDFFAWAKQEFYEGNDEFPYGGGLPIYSWNTSRGFQFLIKKPANYNKSYNWQEFDFSGGLYAVFSAWLPEIMEKYQSLIKWLENSTLYELDKQAELEGRYTMSNIITPYELREKLKNEQHDVFVPIKLK